MIAPYTIYLTTTYEMKLNDEQYNSTILIMNGLNSYKCSLVEIIPITTNVCMFPLHVYGCLSIPESTKNVDS